MYGNNISKFGLNELSNDPTDACSTLSNNIADLGELKGFSAKPHGWPSARIIGDGFGQIIDGSAADGGSSAATSVATTASATTTSLTIKVTWDSSVSKAPSGFVTAVMSAVQYLESRFSDPVTISIDVGYGEVAGSSLPSGALGESRWSLDSYSYSQLRNALMMNAKSASDSTAVASLPSSSPVGGTFWTTTAQAKALGLLGFTGIDGYVGFSSSKAFDYNDADGVTSGTFDFESIALHEITEVLGRDLLTGRSIGGTSPNYSIYDLFHYRAPGVRDFSASTAGYFSINNGTTSLDPFNTSGGDAGDWGAGAGNDAFNNVSSSGVINSISNADLTALDAIGWDRIAASGLKAPTGVTISPITGSLAGLPTSSGLAASKQIACGMQTGGYSVDSCSYTLGGTGAGAFTLSVANGLGTLSTGAAGLPGATNGRLYSLTLKVTDTTDGLSSPAAPLDVVVGSSGADIIKVASLVGLAQAANPTFIYGLAGNDTINASGMTGQIRIDGGGGADVLTGGSGANDYLYGAASDSTSTAMDVVTNFHASVDLIDLTGLGTKLQYVGVIAGKTLNAQTVGWQQSGGNTFVYVNATLSGEVLGSTNMAIELHGLVSLSSANLLHH